MKFKTLILCLMLLVQLFLFTAPAMGAELKLIRTIGDDENDDYIFYQIDSAVIAPDKTIYVLDRKGLFIAQYDWNGKFIKRKGKKGNGSGDYLSPRSLQFYDNHLYVHDFFNWRIAIINRDLERQDYLKLSHFKYQDGKVAKSPGGFILLDKDTFLGTHMFHKENPKRLFVFNHSLEISKRFYDYIPAKEKFNEPDSIGVSKLTNPKVGVNRSAKRLLATSHFTETEIAFFLYDFSGNFIKQFSLKQDNKYQFPVILINAPMGKKKLRNGDCFSAISLIKGFKDGFGVFLEQVENGATKEESKTLISCLIFSGDGQLLHKVDTKHRFLALDMTEDGYVIGKKIGQDFDQLVIYKLEL